MAAPGVRFFAYARFSDNAILGSYAMEKKNETALKQEALVMLEKIKPLELKPEERQKCTTANGSWFLRVDKNQVAYLGLFTADYPERHAYRMIDETQKQLEDIPNYHEASPEEI